MSAKAARRARNARSTRQGKTTTKLNTTNTTSIRHTERAQSSGSARPTRPPKSAQCARPTRSIQGARRARNASSAVKTPLVSVIIPTRNRAAKLRQAIESVLALQHEGFDIEVIVADDASTDNTREVVAEYPVTYVRSETPGGASGGRNLGLAHVNGDFIAFLDDDDEWLPNNLTPQMNMLAEHPEYGAVHGQAILVDPEGKPYHTTKLGTGLASGNIFEDMLTYFPQIGTVVVRAEAAWEIGKFDPTLAGDQDWDWILRIARRYPFGRVPEAMLLFKQRELGNIALQRKRFPDFVRVFRKNTRDLPPGTRIRLERTFWRHRGWWASQFVLHGQQLWRDGDRKGAWLSHGYALRASPPHTVVFLLSQALRRIGIRRPRRTQ